MNSSLNLKYKFKLCCNFQINLDECILKSKGIFFCKNNKKISSSE